MTAATSTARWFAVHAPHAAPRCCFSIFFVNVSAASSSRTCRSSSLYYHSSSAASSGALLVFTPPFQGRAPPGRRAQRSFPSRSAPPHHADVRGKGLSRRRRAASSVECRCHVGRAVLYGEGAVRGGERRMSRTSSGAWGHEIRKRCSARVRQDASFCCGHAAIWSGTFKRRP